MRAAGCLLCRGRAGFGVGGLLHRSLRVGPSDRSLPRSCDLRFALQVRG
jgi:hypothetical protein